MAATHSTASFRTFKFMVGSGSRNSMACDGYITRSSFNAFVACAPFFFFSLFVIVHSRHSLSFIAFLFSRSISISLDRIVSHFHLSFCEFECILIWRSAVCTRCGFSLQICVPHQNLPATYTNSGYEVEPLVLPHSNRVSSSSSIKQ